MADATCPHLSYDGVDHDWTPDKVWRCTGCGRLVRFVYDPDGFEREVVLTDDPVHARYLRPVEVEEAAPDA